MIIREKLNIGTPFKDFIETDESVVTSGMLLIDSEILENVRGTSDVEEDDDEEDRKIYRELSRQKKQKKP